MRYLVYFCVALILSIMLYGLAVASGNEGSTVSRTNIVYVETQNREVELNAEVERLRALIGIREVLEENLPAASIEDKRALAETILEASELYGLKVELVLAVIKTESAFDDMALSHKGAMGLMQLLPSTGMAMAGELSMSPAGKSSLYDMRTNIILGCHYLKKMMNRYSRLDHALQAYNIGPTRFDMLLATNSGINSSYAKQVKSHMTAITKSFFIESREFD
jgi:soluble lytic murein transglycosylase-like protein